MLGAAVVTALMVTLSVMLCPRRCCTGRQRYSPGDLSPASRLAPITFFPIALREWQRYGAPTCAGVIPRSADT